MRNVEWEYKFMERKEAENSNIAMEIYVITVFIMMMMFKLQHLDSVRYV